MLDPVMIGVSISSQREQSFLGNSLTSPEFFSNENRRGHSAMLKPAVEVHNVDGILVAEFWECFRLDPTPVQELRTLYEAHLASKGKPVVVIDLLGVGYAGSAALGNFMAMHRLAKQSGGRLIFCNVDPTVFEVFRASKLDPLFTFVADRDAALAHARQPAASPAESEGTASTSIPSAAAPASSPPLRKSGGNGLISASRRRKLS